MEAKKNTPFWDAALPIEKRLDWLLEEMTIEEKLECLSSSAPDLERLGIPGMSVGGEAAHGVEARNDQNDLGEAEPTTSFVQPIGISSTWDPELIRKAGEVVGTEARVLYHRHPDRGLSRWAPTVDIERDPRWGRTEEGYGEDPLLTGEMASAYIRGLEGEHPKYLRVAATLKHFYGNNTEVGRGWKNSSIDPRNKYELYLETFRRVIEKGKPEAVMTAYNKINGTPGMLNHEVQDILKDQYGLKHAVSDGGAMTLVAGSHHYFGTHAETLAASLKAGVDAMSDDPHTVAEAAREGWELGILEEKDVDRAIRNMFRTKLRLGIYDRDAVNPFDCVTEADLLSEESKKICSQVSREAVVLLKNQENILPLAKEEAEGIALIGPLADVWYPDWYGGKAPFTTTLKQGVEEVSGLSTEYTDGLDHVIFQCGNKGIAVADDETLYLSENPDIFVKEEWGEGSYTFRCVRTGKYMNTRFGNPAENMQGRLAAERENVLDWFVFEKFGLSEQENGVVLLDRFEKPVQVHEDGSLWTGNSGEGTVFGIKVVKDGLKEAVALAAGKKTVILALGCNSMINAKEEVDRTTISLPSRQEMLAREIAAINKRVIVVLFSNYAYALGEIKECIPAMLWSATGAQDMGLAMAETIFGINAPAGRLSLTWYKDDSQLPDIDDYDIIKGKRTYRYFTEETLYPFGHGLTYTQFAYSNLQAFHKNESVMVVQFEVTNLGERASDEVAQVYGAAPVSRVRKPVRQLLGFKRLKDVCPGETRTVRIEIPISEFAFYDVVSRRMMVESGVYTVYAGASSAEAEISSQIEIHGEELLKRDLSVKIAADHYDDYENIVLTEGHFGYKAVTPKDNGQKGVLVYKSCILPEKGSTMVLHMHSARECCVEIAADGKVIGRWNGNTREYALFPQMALDSAMARELKERIASWEPVYTDVRIPLSGVSGCEPVDVMLTLTGDAKLCYLRME